MDTHQLKAINKALIDKYGKGPDGRAKWRLIENTKTYTEKRYGTFSKFDAHGNYLGNETCVRNVPKYSYIPNGIYLLEQLYHTDNLPLELALAQISNQEYYECRWPFMSNDMEYMEPTLEGCLWIIKAVLTINKKPKKTEEERTIEKHQKTVEMLSEGDPAFIGPMTTVPNNYESTKKSSQGETKDVEASTRPA